MVRKRIARRNPSPPLCPSTVMRSSFVLLDKDLHKGEAYQKKDKKTNNNISRIPSSRVRECTGLNPCARRARERDAVRFARNEYLRTHRDLAPGSEDAKEHPSSFIFRYQILFALKDIIGPASTHHGRTKRERKKERKISTRNSYPLRSRRVRLNGERRSLGDGGRFRDGNFRADERG